MGFAVHAWLSNWSWRVLGGIRSRGGATLTRVLRLSGAAVAAYLAALLLLADPRPVLAPLTALLIVQVTLVGTITDSARRILSVVAGVAIAIVFSAFVGFSWWSLGLLIAASIVLGQALRLGPHLLEVPISAMLVLSVGGSENAALDRVSATVVGAAVGLLVNLIFPPAVQTRTAGAAVEAYAEQLSQLLDRVADEVAHQVTVEQVGHWLEEARELANNMPGVERVVATAEQSRKLNPRAVGATAPEPGLRSGLEALEHAAVALRALYRSLADQARHHPGAAQLYDEHVREVFAALLRELARAIRDFGSLVCAEAEQASDSDTGKLAVAVDSAQEARAMLTDLLLVDPQADPDSWQRHGALLAAVDRVLRELDAAEYARQRAARQQRSAEETTRTAATMDRLRTVTKTATHTVAEAVTDAVAELPYRRGDRGSRDPESD
jgi:hypothetical protein